VDNSETTMNINTFDAKELLDAAKVAESSERFGDMCAILKKMVLHKCGENIALGVEERNMLSIAYKTVVGEKRQSWRSLTQGNTPDLPKDVLDEYKKFIETELENVCNEALELLIKATGVAKTVDEGGEDVIFYLKMSGDYNRYLSEFSRNNSYSVEAEKCYRQATEIAKTNLLETHPTRLGLALNYSVCCYEILHKKQGACSIAKEAFDAAIEKLDTLNDASYKDSTLIMQLLRDNLTIWTSEREGAEETQE